ncbi:MAG: 16S rRNA (guanine(527)-N(7))-methyltransferase RsmG [Synechococcales cyanobacterium]
MSVVAMPWQETLDWQPSSEVLVRFQQLHERVILGNQQQNLTRLTDAADFWEKHLWDSLRGLHSGATLSALGTQTASLIDLGTGAGFPGIPIALVLPHWAVTLVDATKRKIAFVQETATALGLTQVTTVAERAEPLGHRQGYREAFDWAVIRAVGAAPVCAEYALPCVKVGGKAILYRGHWTADEEVTLRQVLEQLGGSLVKVDAFQTPLSQAVRHCLVIEKVAPIADRFPRAIGIPAKEPLI